MPKILSKRQINRRSRANFIKLTQMLNIDHDLSNQKISVQTNKVINQEEYSSPSDILVHKNVSTIDRIEDVSTEIFQSSSTLPTNINLPSVFQYSQPTFKEDKSGSLPNVLEEINFKNKFRHWVISHNISSNAVTQLLKILNPIVNFLPLDYRSLMETPRKTPTIKLKNGEMYYFGLANKLLFRMKQGIKSQSCNKLSIQINIDGIPLFKSSSTEFYPILGMCTNLIDNSPFAIAIFCGCGKPDPLDLFLKNFVEEINLLKQNFIEFDNRKFMVDISFILCDAPARAYIKQIVGHTGLHGCEKCTIVGKYENKRVNFAHSTDVFSLREDSDFLNSELNEHIKGRSPLLNADIKLISQVPLDPMHLVFLGVTKRLLLKYLINGPTPYKLSQNIIKEINLKISDMQAYVPSDFTRKPRSFKEVCRWKATEFRMFLLYTVPVLLKNALNREMYEHFLLFHSAIFILSDSFYIERYLEEAKKNLKHFVADSQKIYGKDFIVYNVHSLLHLCDEVKLHGDINNFTCFPFENYLGSIKSEVHSKKYCLQQIHRRIEEYEKCLVKRKDSLSRSINPTPKIISNEVYDSMQNLVSFSCAKICFASYILTLKKSNNCVLLKNKKVCLITKIRYANEEYLFEGISFHYYFNLYDKPLQSVLLNIFFVSKMNARNALTFKINDILCKCFRIPYKNGFAIFPMMHSF